MESLRFLDPETAESIRTDFGSPAFVYHEAYLLAQAKAALSFPNAFGLTVRYAMKACPNAAILRLFDQAGLSIDASSGHEVARAMRAGVGTEKISLSTQELPEDFASLVEDGVKINLCSLSQLERYAERFPNTSVGLRFNPGLGSGGTAKTNVGGPSSSFGIWKDDLDRARSLAAGANLSIERIHTHIGSGSDPEVWKRVALLSLDLAEAFPQVNTVNLGGGFKVARIAGETGTDLQLVGEPVKRAFEDFAERNSRSLQLEIEPGTFLVANAGALVATIQDITSTGPEGNTFLKLDSGMTEILRPSLYGAQHPIVTLPKEVSGNETFPYVVVGHCCESGDLLTPAENQPDVLAPRELALSQVGDLCVIEGVGAYCSAMSAKNYNSFPESPEVLLRTDGSTSLIRKRQTLDQIMENEILP
ncbi:MAG: diaminopimelate decarboxylase [Opitutae bacterium]|nr:diaminopimelate decarboxylase [Opitutae bacterium]|tara:strand:- start:2420 stop:3676 length:1257 start_codon:yes stop_codon:yes gene_type:complete